MKLIGEEPRVKRIAPKAKPKLLKLPANKDPYRMGDMEVLLRENLPQKERSILRTFRMFMV